MKLLKNYPLKQHNTFNIDASALYFTFIGQLSDIMDAISAVPQARKIFVLGGGSNVVFRTNFDGLILKSALKGIRIVRSDGEHSWVECYGGEQWQDLVDYALKHNLSGLENLSAIPGSVGAAPVQNIGAYGVEIKDVLESVETIDLGTGETRLFTNSECNFGYRDSIFKRELKARYFVTKIVIKLSQKPVFHIDYADIKKKLTEYNDQPLSTNLLSRAITEIRSLKLPDPEEIGNCGSFFKNCMVSKEAFKQLRTLYPSIPGYTESTDEIKIPSGWLIEQCGWKGWRKGDAAVYPKHALILVNYGNATGQEIYELSEQIIAGVKEKFGLILEREALIV